MEKPRILIEPHIDSIIMPENLRVGLMVAKQRKKCQNENKCDAEYYGFAFGQSPFHVPVILNNPHNPTGALYTEDERKEIADVCRNHNSFVLADEIYALTTYQFERFTSMRRIYPEGTFVTNGLSKDRSSGGYRLGSCILPDDCSEDLKEAFRKVAATVYTNVSTPTQYAAITAYEPNEELDEYFTVTREIHRVMGQYMSAGFNEIGGIKATIPQTGVRELSGKSAEEPVR